MAWYRSGTVSLTNGSATVTGSGTAFIANVSVGEGFLGPDGRTYEITDIASNTSLTISPMYMGSTASGQSYAIAPLRGSIPDLIAETSSLLASFSSVRDGIGSGNFPDGSAAAPAFRFTNDQDTGFYRAGDNALAIATGAAGRVFITATGRVGIGTSSPNALLHGLGGVSNTPTVARIQHTAGGSDFDYAAWLLTTGGAAGGLVAWAPGSVRANELWVQTDNAAPLVFGTTDTERVRITPTGDVGIGVSDPGTYRLNVAKGSRGNVAQFSDGVESTFVVRTEPSLLQVGQANNLPMAVLTNGLERMRITAAGNVGIGTTSPQATLHAANSSPGDVARFQGEGASAYIYADAANVGFFNTANAGAGRDGILIASGTQVGIEVDATSIAIATSIGLLSGADNGRVLGSAGLRWSTVYAGTGTINTSDEREKTWRGALTADELRAAKRIIGELGIYQWNDAVAEKGADDARLHFGVRAQQVFAIMEDEGLDWQRYAWCCHDEWDEQTEPELDEDGEPTGETIVTVEAGDRYGIRPDQLAFWLIAAQADIQADLEARIAALEAA